MIRAVDGKVPRVASSAFVSEAAYVVGDVEIGENASIWPGAVLRGDWGSIKVGARTKIEDNTVVHCEHGLTIGDDVTIGHSVVVHCAKVGNRTLIGSHATLLDDAEIGNYCIVGAASLVTPGMKIPDRSFVIGAPAFVKSEISEKHFERLERGSPEYQALAGRYLEQGL